MTKNSKNKQQIDITLKYSGADVDDGSMSIEDIIPVLQGFSSVYGKISSSLAIEEKHEIRLEGVEQGSFDIIMAVWVTIGAISPQLASLDVIASSTKLTIKTIIDLIKFQKHVQKEPYTERIESKNKVDITNSQGVTLNFPVTVYNIAKDSIAEADLAKIVKPIQEGHIDSAKIIAKVEDETFSEEVDVKTKEFFDNEVKPIVSTQSAWLQGRFNSLTKSTNKGYFLLNDGSRVTYHLANDNPEDLYEYFLHKGLVKVRCEVHLDENLKPQKIDIFEIDKVQLEIFDTDNN